MRLDTRLRGGLAMLTALAFLCGPQPAGSPALAQGSQIGRSVSSSLTNDLQQFSTGNLQRTGLSTIKGGGASDLNGAVQLLPSGEITTWRDAAGDLPLPRAEHASVYLEYATVGNVKKGRIFVLGGRAGTGSPNPVKSVLSAEVQQELIITGSATIDRRGELIIPSGQTNAWRSEPDLPLQLDNADNTVDPDTDPQVAERTNLAAVAIPKSGGGGYIYAIGGLYSQPYDEINAEDFVSSPEVSIATVNAQGQLTAWRNGRKLNIGSETNADDDVALRSASAFAITAQNGKTYLYVVGGATERFNGDEIEIVGSDRVLRSEVNLNTGDLGPWQVAATIPVRADQAANDDITVGVWDAGVAYVRLQPQDGLPRDSFFLIGGQARVARTGADSADAIFLSEVYRANIDANGNVTFAPVDNNAGSLVSDFSQHTVATYNGAIYTLGGVEGNSSAPTSAVQGSYAEETPGTGEPQLGTPGIEGSTANFVRNDNLGPNKRRASHTTVVVPAGETKAYVYVIGGRGQGTAAEPDVFFGQIGEDQTVTRFVPNGWYYSQVYDIVEIARQQGYNIETGTLRDLSWDSTMTQTLGHDIQLWYRTSNAASLDPATPWIPITATLASAGKGSVDGETGVGGKLANRATLGEENARLIQFRAQLISARKEGTPLLRRVALDFDINGSPNLKFPDNPFTRVLTTNAGKPAIDNVTVKIANKDTAEPPLIDARYSNDLTEFYVELYINPTNKPPAFGTQGVAFTRVKADLLTKNAEVELKQWCNPVTSPPTGCTPIAITSFLTQTGSYEFYAYVDQMLPADAASSPFGLVPESGLGPTAPNEQDNVTLSPLTITIAPPEQIPAECISNPNQPQCPLAPDPDPTPRVCPDPTDRADPTCVHSVGDPGIRMPVIMFNR